VLAQLGNRVQHALRAFTARDQRDLRLAAQTYRPNPRFSTEAAIREVGTGEAVTSFLDEKGAPGMVERTLVRPPSSALGPIDAGTRAALIAASPLAGKYDRAVDRDSAHEMLARRAEAAAREAEAAERAAARAATEEQAFRAARRYSAPERGAAPRRPAPARRTDGVADAFAKSFARQLGSRSGQALVRGILGGLFKAR
jgi:hypothetical protein